MPRNVHHAITHRGSHKHADGSHNQNGTESGDFRSDGRVQEVHGIVAHADNQVHDGQHEQEQDETKIHYVHNVQ